MWTTLTVGSTYTSEWKQVTTSSYYRGCIALTLVSQDKESSPTTSTLNVTLKFYSTDGTFSSNMYWRGYVRLGSFNLFDLTDGTRKTSSGSATADNPKVLNLGTITVKHEDDGTFPSSGFLQLIDFGYGYSSYTGKKTTTYDDIITIPSIPVSTLTITPNTGLILNSSTMTISVESADSSWSHHIYAVSTTSSSVDVLLGILPAGTTSKVFTAPTSLSSLMTSQTQTLTIRSVPVTSSGTELTGTTATATFEIPSTEAFAPNISTDTTYTKVSPIQPSFLEGYTGYVSGYSKISFSVRVTKATYGAEISTVTTKIDNSLTSLTISSSNSTSTVNDWTGTSVNSVQVSTNSRVPVLITATDVKGVKSEYTIYMDVSVYSPPSNVTITGTVTDSAGKPSTTPGYVTVQCTWRVTGLGEDNTYNPYTVTVSCSEVISGSSSIVTEYTSVTEKTGSSPYTYTFNAYDEKTVTIIVTDAFGSSVTKSRKVSSRGVFLNFNSTGNGMAIGMKSTLSDVLDIGYPVRFYNGIMYRDLGTYDLNNLVDSGYYYSTNFSNKPSELEDGIVYATIYSADNVRILQSIVSIGSDNTCHSYRRVNYAGTAWSSWIITEVPVEIASILDKVYPIGSIYLSINATNPATTLGVGTWELLEKGKFLMSATDDGTVVPGTTGGNTAHDHYSPVAINGTLVAAVSGNGATLNTTTPVDSWVAASGSSGGATSFSVKQGKTSSSNNIPPYIAVCMWKRIE